MSHETQCTVGSEVTLDGTGVHSGEGSRLTFKAAEPDTGVRFVRTDLDGAPEVPADLDHVVATNLGTTLGLGEVRVLTVEHLMAALYGTGVDNARIELTGPEIPIRDGSFRDYVSAIADAGVVVQDRPARKIRISSPVSFDGPDGESYVATSAEGLRISGTIDFDHPAIGRSFGSFVIERSVFERELAGARTFGFVTEWDTLRERGLALGANLENTIVLDEGEILNEDLRYPDEFLRHKVGDVVGDLALLGARLDTHVVTERPSHAGNVGFARSLAQHARRQCRKPFLDASQIMQYLPHRYPMLLVDRIVDFEEGKRIVGIKNVTINEPFFQGHYPDHPVMPGVLIVEAMAQVGGLLLINEQEHSSDQVVYFMSLDNVKWRRPVTPGDTLVFELELVQHRRRTCKMRGLAYVDGQRVAEADMMAMLVDR